MTRHPGLDAVRAVAIVLVVAAHAALSYLVTPIGWAIQDDSHHLAFDIGVFFVAAFIMPVFFWLSGHFARAVYLQRGPVGYLRHRATRLGVPIAIAIVPCSLALDALWDWGRELAVRPTVATDIPKLEGSQLPITLGHLWFLYYVLFVSIAALIAVELRKRLGWPRPGTVSAMWIVPVAAIVSTLVLVASGAWHLDTPLGFLIHVRAAVYFAAFFGWGWAVHAHPDQLERYARHGWRALVVSLGFFAAILPGLAELGARAPVLASVASGGFTVALVIGFLGLCVRHARHPSAAIALISSASYWTYVVHLPLVVLLQIKFSRVAWPAPIEYLAILGATVAACAVSYAAFAHARRSLAGARRAPDTEAPARSGHTP